MTNNRISLSKGKFAIISECDYELVSQIEWHAKRDGRRYYACGWVGPHESRKLVKLHRFILNPPDDMEVDHINGNGLDCRRENMRVCTKTQNMRNRRKFKGVSRYKGVDWYGRSNKWRARIRVNGKLLHLGYFEEESAAARAYDLAAIEHFGRFANLNFGGVK